MTLYTALTTYGTRGENIQEVTLVFPKGFPMESACYGVSGMAFACIAEEAPDAFTLNVNHISITIDHDLVIWTEYGDSYKSDIRELLTGKDEDMLPPDVWTAIRWLGWDLKKEDDFTIGELKKIASICKCDLDKVLEEIREEK